jgi:RNA polymerase sigma-70 factor (ECF subfamily)
LEDDIIIDMFFSRQESAIREANIKYGQRLYRSAMNILYNSQDAEECVNDALFKAWETIPPNRPTMFGAFLAKITRNLAINKLRAKGALRRGGNGMDLLLSELEECIPTNKGHEPEQAYEAALLSQAINTCLISMDQTARVAFILRYFHGESIHSICERFNMSESKVKSLLFRARKKLSIHLQKEGISL